MCHAFNTHFLPSEGKRSTMAQSPAALYSMITTPSPTFFFLSYSRQSTPHAILLFCSTQSHFISLHLHFQPEFLPRIFFFFSFFSFQFFFPQGACLKVFSLKGQKQKKRSWRHGMFCYYCCSLCTVGSCYHISQNRVGQSVSQMEWIELNRKAVFAASTAQFSQHNSSCPLFFPMSGLLPFSLL
ncbi:hypothetical protein VTN77DRAFT_6378 [Rasamsonia byssochlamydoides]|uniref:uncharacterized protein n=1 Tax=Rasamsonia byssochlamydoides TaxID=89139 RepID=UPI00374259D9